MHRLLPSFSLACIIGSFYIVVTLGCEKENPLNELPDNAVDFVVNIENVSTTTTLQTGALPNRTAPIGNGVWAVLSGGKLFEPGRPADEGTSRLAEDCMPIFKIRELDEATFVKSHGEFKAPGGPDDGPAIFAGETSTFIVRAQPGDKLQIQTMFVQSNDWFYAFHHDGIDLFSGNTPVEGDFTGQLELYDAGTEADEMPGIGYMQKLDQDPSAMNFGPADRDPLIRDAVGKHPTLVIPTTNSVVRITINPTAQ